MKKLGDNSISVLSSCKSVGRTLPLFPGYYYHCVRW